MWGHEGLDSWGQFHIMRRLWHLPTGCIRWKVLGVKADPWAPGVDMGQHMRSQAAVTNVGKVSMQDRIESHFPLALSLDMFLAREAWFLCLLDWTSIDLFLFRILSAVKQKLCLLYQKSGPERHWVPLAASQKAAFGAHRHGHKTIFWVFLGDHGGSIMHHFFQSCQGLWMIQ